MRKIIIVFTAVILLLSLFGCGKTDENTTQEKPVEEGYTGAPVYIHKLCPGENTFWIVRCKFENGDFNNYLYRLDENDNEEYVRQLPWVGFPCAWNREKERFYYLSESELCEYDPLTAEVVAYTLEGEYSWVECSYDNRVYLINNKTLKDTLFLLDTGEETQVALGRSPVIDKNDEYIIIEGNADASVSCYDAETNDFLWKSAPFTVRTSVDACISGDKVYMSSDDSSGVFVRALDGDEEAVMTNIQSRTHAVADGGEYVVCAVRAYKSIEFKALYHDGRVEDIAVWDNVNFSLVGSVLLEVWNGKLYCTITTEEGLFICKLP